MSKLGKEIKKFLDDRFKEIKAQTISDSERLEHYVNTLDGIEHIIWAFEKKEVKK